MTLAKSQQSLKNWSKQKWRTKSGKKSSVTGERYLPEKAIKALSSSEYAATTAAKKAGNYTKPTMRKKIFQRIKSQASHGTKAGQWSARKAQALAKAYKKAGGGYK